MDPIIPPPPTPLIKVELGPGRVAQYRLGPRGGPAGLMLVLDPFYVGRGEFRHFRTVCHVNSRGVVSFHIEEPDETRYQEDLIKMREDQERDHRRGT